MSPPPPPPPPAAPAPAPAPTQLHGHEVNPFERSFASPPPASHPRDPQVAPKQPAQDSVSHTSTLESAHASDQRPQTLPPPPPSDVNDDVDPRLPGIPPPEVLERLHKHPDHSPKPSLPGMKHISPSLNLPDDLDRFKNWASLAEKWGQPTQGTPLSPGSLLSLAAPPLRSGGNTPSGLSRVLPAVSSSSSPGSQSVSPPRSSTLLSGNKSNSNMHSSPALGLRAVDPSNANQFNGVGGPSFLAGKPKIPLPARRQPNSSSSSLFQIASQIPTPTPIYTSLAARSSAPSSAVHSEASNDSMAQQQDATSSPHAHFPSQMSPAPSPAVGAVSSPAHPPLTSVPTPPPPSSVAPPFFHPSPVKEEPHPMQPPVSMHQQLAPAAMPVASLPYPPFGPYAHPPTMPNSGPMSLKHPPQHMAYGNPHPHHTPQPFMHAPFQHHTHAASRSESLTPAPGTPNHPPTAAPMQPNGMSMSPALTPSHAPSPLVAPAMVPMHQHQPQPQQQVYNEQGFAHYQQQQQQRDISDLPPGFLGQPHGPTDITRLGVEHIPVIPPQKKGNTKRKVDYDALDDKRKEFLERNRKAAMKCRQRKKQQLTLMETKAQGFTIHNEQLEAQLIVFRNEIDRLQAALQLANAAHCAPTAMAALAVPPPPPTAAVYNTDPLEASSPMSVSPVPGTPVLGPESAPADNGSAPMLNAR